MTDLTLSPDQEAAFRQLYAWTRSPTPLLTFGGYAGTGKTTLLGALAREVGSRHRIAFCAPTGRAASVLGRKLKEAGVSLARHSCSTIHALAAMPVEDTETGEITGWRQKSELKDELGEFSLIVIDEASMVGTELFEMLSRFGVPILAVGDHGQLPPIMSQMNLMRDPEVRLEQIHRQAADSPIIRLATKVREGSQVEPWDADGTAVCFVDKKEWKEIISSTYTPNKLRPSLESVILCQTNSVRTAFNAEVRRQLGLAGDPEQDEVVVCLKNIKWAGIFNGFRGIIKRPEVLAPHHIWADVVFPAERQRLYKSRLCRYQFGREKTITSFVDLLEHDFEVSDWRMVGHLFDWGYAMTVHKAQGSEWPLVVLCKESRGWSMSKDTYRRWLYTAVTRASERLVVLG